MNKFDKIYKSILNEKKDWDKYLKKIFAFEDKYDWNDKVSPAIWRKVAKEKFQKHMKWEDIEKLPEVKFTEKEFQDYIDNKGKHGGKYEVIEIDFMEDPKEGLVYYFNDTEDN